MQEYYGFSTPLETDNISRDCGYRSGAEIPVAQFTKFWEVPADISSIVIALFFVTYKNVCQGLVHRA